MSIKCHDLPGAAINQIVSYNLAFGWFRTAALREIFKMTKSETLHSVALKSGCLFLGLALLATGLFFSVGGARLAALHGSLYFLSAGIVIVAAAIQFIRRKSSAVLVYGAAFVGTLLWALADAGLDFWPLVSRLMLPTGLMLLALLAWPALRKAETGKPTGRGAYVLAAVLALAMSATFVQMFQPHPRVCRDKGGNDT